MSTLSIIILLVKIDNVSNFKYTLSIISKSFENFLLFNLISLANTSPLK